MRQSGDNCTWVLLLASAAIAALSGWASCTAATPEEHAIEVIRATAVATPTDAHPLPLVASWSNGEVATGFGPAYQLEQIRRGRYLLPWFYLRPPSEAAGATYARPGDAVYYESAIRYLAQHRLPLSFEATQWESVMRPMPTGPDGKPLPLSPFSSIDAWYAAGREWARLGALHRLQELYPDPPLVLLISNNEQAKLLPKDLQVGASASTDAATDARRLEIGDAWIERYRALIRGFRDGLSPGWRAHALFVGYDAFVTPAIGRWFGWRDYCLSVAGRTDPFEYAWDGASVSFYVHDWAGDSDYTVWSPQIESMNFVAELEQLRKVKPHFWFEMSSWDGQQPGRPTDKRQFYAERGQQLTPERYGGMVQFGLWLLRPRVVREFRNHEDDPLRVGPYLDAVFAAVARVHDNPTLANFWERGRLVHNPNGGHPYREALPAEWASRQRWFLLETEANPPRPWELLTPLKVFALALERGSRPRREWLIYAFSPQDEGLDTDVQIPGAARQRIHASRSGTFTMVIESDGSARPIKE